MSLIYAIDYGTTNSLLGAASSSQLHDPIPLDPAAQDPTIFRSILYFPTMSRCFYGAQAIQEFVHNDMEGRLIRSIKKFLPSRSFVGTWVENRPINLETIIAFFLKEMRRRANEHFNADVDSVVLGRPAKFAPDEADDRFAQSRLERAAREAGFKNIEFCAEPIAAAMEFRAQIREPKIVLVGDFGGGTSDYTIMRITPDGQGKKLDPRDVLAIGGVSVAGDALDGAMMRHKVSPHFGADVEYTVPFGSNVLTMPKSLVESITSPADISLLRQRDTMEFFRNVRTWSLGDEDRIKMDRLFALIEDQLGFSVFEEIEKTKRKLSQDDAAEFRFEYPDVEIEEEVTRAEFDEITSDRVRKIIDALDDTIRAAGIRPSEIDLVCCTGGTAKVPAIRNAMVSRFGAEKIQDHLHFHSVVRGLSHRARDLL